ncbi:hypothetical protein pb186bvf_003821 [Paramecium bursaria]
MGNEMCSSQHHKNVLKTIKADKSILLKINRQFIQEIGENHKDFYRFHHEIIQELIMKEKFQYHEPQIWIKYPKDRDNDIEFQIFQQLSQSLQRKKRCLFNKIIESYRSFLVQIFEIDNNSQDCSEFRISMIASSKISNQSTSAHIDQRQTHHKLKSMFQKDYSLSKLVVAQISCIHNILQQIIIMMFGSQIDYIFGVDIDEQFEKENMLARIVQQQILTKQFPLRNILKYALKYRFKKSLIKTSIQEPKLDAKLLPNSIGSDIKPILNLERLESSKNLEYRGLDHHLSKLPYHQAFRIVELILQTSKPWLKIKLISRLDQMIIDIFMNHKHENQFDENLENIVAEDSRSEVMFFLLHKFMEKNQQLIKQNLLEFNWMKEDDVIISKDQKYLLCPYFMRFAIILEMVASQLN